MAERRPPLFGIAAEFAREADLMHAVDALLPRDFGRVEAFTPAPVPGLADRLDVHHASLRWIGIGAAAFGAAGFFGMCAYATISDYPFLIAGRPRFSWPYYVIPSVSVGMLIGALATTFGMLYLARLPRLNHPAFNIMGFERASRDRYFLTVEPRGDSFDAEAVADFFRQLSPQPLSLQRVPR